jgi:hypothetical protein
MAEDDRAPEASIDESVAVAPAELVDTVETVGDDHDHAEGRGLPVARLLAGVVGTTELADGAVTTPKLADGAVTPGKVLGNAIAGWGLVPPGAVVWFRSVADLTAAGAGWTRQTTLDGRYPIGSGTSGTGSGAQTFVEGGTPGNTWEHQHGDDHTHTTADHGHTMGNHTHAVGTHSHAMKLHTHGITAHSHAMKNHTHGTGDASLFNNPVGGSVAAGTGATAAPEGHTHAASGNTGIPSDNTSNTNGVVASGTPNDDTSNVNTDYASAIPSTNTTSAPGGLATNSKNLAGFGTVTSMTNWVPPSTVGVWGRKL